MERYRDSHCVAQIVSRHLDGRQVPRWINGAASRRQMHVEPSGAAPLRVMSRYDAARDSAREGAMELRPSTALISLNVIHGRT